MVNLSILIERVKRKKLKNRIKEFRIPKGLSQYRLGKKINLSRISINRIETEKTIPTLKIAYDIAEALGVCIYQIFDLDGTGNYKCKSCNCNQN